MKTCTFVGHKRLKNKTLVKKKIEKVVKDLISKGVKEFLFGSSSEFVDLCYEVVTSLKEEFKDIIRIGCPCGNETFYTQQEAKNQEKEFERVLKRKIKLSGYEKIMHINFGSLDVYNERDKRLVEESDVCVLYLIGNYISNSNKKISKLEYLPSYGANSDFTKELCYKNVVIIKS